VPPSKSGITFKNVLEESPKSNVLTYEYFYNGGGVSVGDINNDGLEDVVELDMNPEDNYRKMLTTLSIIPRVG
jgi:hypothetical protein